MSFKTKEEYDMKIVFMGTPDFAVPSLKSLINEFGVEAVLLNQIDQREEERN